MARAMKLAACCLAATLASMVWCGPSASKAQRSRVRSSAVRIAVGEVAARRPEGERALAEALTEAIERAPAVLLSETRRAQLVVGGSIVRWDRRAVAEGLEVRCEVSLIVSDARGGSIRAMLRGRGGARGGGGAERLSREALQAAVRGALRPLSTQGAALAQG